MSVRFCIVKISALLVVSAYLISCASQVKQDASWQLQDYSGEFTARHEAAFLDHQQKLYLLGGRRVNPTDIFDPTTQQWSTGAKPPFQVHHFQAVSYAEDIYILSAFTGGWPKETPVDKVMIYKPKEDRFEFSHSIPEDRRRGAGAAVVYQGEIYTIGGIVNGHMSGSVSWFDKYDPTTGEWTRLDDSPRPRDHFQAAVYDHKLFLVGGRTTSQATNEGFTLTIPEIDYYDFRTQQWNTLPTDKNLPVLSAGNMVSTVPGGILVGGGESGTQVVAHSEVFYLDANKLQWQAVPSLNLGRHGTGFAHAHLMQDAQIMQNAQSEHRIYTISGSGNRGGEPELTNLEYLTINDILPDAKDSEHSSALGVFQIHRPMKIDFKGPYASETDDNNPFLNYKLSVTFTHEDQETTIRGFFAADGNSAHSSSENGSIWRVNFTPPKLGKWTYQATLLSGDNIAIQTNSLASEYPIEHAKGSFEVVDNNCEEPAFCAFGRLVDKQGYYFSEYADKYWLKGGTNSPENFLAHGDIDGTYRLKKQTRDGESNVDTELHKFDAHLPLWQEGDATWQGEKGKALIGVANYLNQTGLNASYFLTMNINGDGNDVWPYHSPDDFTRFDVSRLAQWEILFSHMQKKGIMLHVVLQETENETLLDGGDTGLLRQLYYHEMIARFAHFNGIVWNLGEENGPANFSPVGQNDQQRKDMADFFAANDPYKNFVLLHTHASNHGQEEILPALLGHQSLDGLSFQVNKPEEVNQRLIRWQKESRDAGKRWMITMDEIGPWQHGARPDSVDSDHDELRFHALWGSLMAGGAGVEWYFGAHHPHNDLSAEDLSSRSSIWKQTTIALDFFNRELAYWNMQALNDIVRSGNAYAFGNSASKVIVYVQSGADVAVNLTDIKTTRIRWFAPKDGEYADEVSDVNDNIKLLSLKTPDSTKDWVAILE